MHRMVCRRDSFFDKFHRSTLHLSPDERATCLEQSAELDALHAEFAQEGQSQAPLENEEIDLHFVTFICQQERLVLLDGRLEQPIVYGSCTEENLLQVGNNKLVVYLLIMYLFLHSGSNQCYSTGIHGKGSK